MHSDIFYIGLGLLAVLSLFFRLVVHLLPKEMRKKLNVLHSPRSGEASPSAFVKLGEGRGTNEKLYLVNLRGAEDPLDRAYRQPVRAWKGEVSAEGHIIFTHEDGTLAAFFDSSAVSSWRQIDEEELAALDRIFPKGKKK